MTTISEKKLLKLGEDFKKLKKENEELKQDNKKLIDNGGYVSEGCANHIFSKLKDDLLIQLREENKKLKEKYETFRVRNCDRMEELVKALSPWKKNNQDHKSILEAIVELKQENEELKQENHKLLGKSICREIRIDKLFNEKKELKEKITMQSHDEDFMHHEMKIIWDENVKLKEENEKLLADKKRESKEMSRRLERLNHFEDFVLEWERDGFETYLDEEGYKILWDSLEIVDKED